MPNILDEIVAVKQKEIAQTKERVSIQQLEKMIPQQGPTRDFTGQLQKPGMRIIAEVKKASPSAGIIRADFDPLVIAQIYEANGADCLSVLTDFPFFQGRLEYLSAIHPTVAIPVLRKEFILDSYQLWEARAAGADAILLIAEILPGDMLKKLYQEAISLGLHVLIELHDAEELPRVLDSGTQLVGINNRNLRTFQTTLDHTLDLMPHIPKDRTVVSESGIRDHKDLHKLEQHGIKAVLVGESLMRSADIGLALRQLRFGLGTN